MTKSKNITIIKMMVTTKKYDFGIDIGIDKELMAIDRLKIDVGTKFKGIN